MKNTVKGLFFLLCVGIALVVACFLVLGCSARVVTSNVVVGGNLCVGRATSNASGVNARKMAVSAATLECTQLGWHDCVVQEVQVDGKGGCIDDTTKARVVCPTFLPEAKESK